MNAAAIATKAVFEVFEEGRQQERERAAKVAEVTRNLIIRGDMKAGAKLAVIDLLTAWGLDNRTMVRGILSGYEFTTGATEVEVSEALTVMEKSGYATVERLKSGNVKAVTFTLPQD